MPDRGGDVVLVEIAAVETAGRSMLADQQRIRFDLTRDQSGKGDEMKTYFAFAMLAGFLAAMPARAENPYPANLGGPGTTLGMASEFNQLVALLSDGALRDIMCRLSGARFTPGNLSSVLGMPEGQVLRRINTLRNWGLVRMVRLDSATTIVEPNPGGGGQTMRRWANRYCSAGDSCGTPVTSADSQRKPVANPDRQGNERKETAVVSGGGTWLFGGDSAPRGKEKPTKGTVKWYDATKGFGFIEVGGSSDDVYVNKEAVERSGLDGLGEGLKVIFDMVPGRGGKMAAANLAIDDSQGPDSGMPNSQGNERKETAVVSGGDTWLFGEESDLTRNDKPSAGTVADTFVTNSSFSELGLADPILRALNTRNHISPTLIQAQAIPKLLAGADVLGIAQTGTGKTAAFALPILHQLSRTLASNIPGRPRALILAPTRELALQIGAEFRAYGEYLRLRHTVIYGGVSQTPQVKALSRGIDIVIATPGRLLDLMNQGRIRLGAVQFFVLDEADRMLDMGFVPDVRKIVSALPKSRQSLMFSATMPGEIAHLSGDILADPIRVEVTPQATPVERLKQSVYHVSARGKDALLAKILDDPALSRVLVFARTKLGVNHVAEWLGKRGIPTEFLHGDKSQAARQRALERFRTGHVRVLVATDVAARGIDVEGITHVINYELPHEPGNYVHRIGRTARAGAGGEAISFCAPYERDYLRDIEHLIRSRVRVIGEDPALAPRRYWNVTPLRES